MATFGRENLGDFIRDQRLRGEVSLRELAKRSGVSNPYLSQVERGLRKPSAEVLQSIAKALQISSDVLYLRAGLLEERSGDVSVPVAIHLDTTLTDRQKHVLLEIYESFRRESAAAPAVAEQPASAEPTDAPASADRPGPDAEAEHAATPEAEERRPN